MCLYFLYIITNHVTSNLYQRHLSRTNTCYFVQHYAIYL